MYKGELANDEITVIIILDNLEKQNLKNTQQTMTPEEWDAI